MAVCPSSGANGARFAAAAPGAIIPDFAANFPHLPRKLFLDYLPPYRPAFAVLVWTFFQAGELGAPLPDQGIQSQQLRLKFDRLSWLVLHRK
jgi:hypothetical protein